MRKQGIAWWKQINWQKLESGQALIEYWPTIPVAVAVMIVAAVIAPTINSAFLRAAGGLSGISCDAPEEVTDGPSTITNLDGGHTIELTSNVYDPVDDRTTITFTVTSGTQPSISHWVLGIDQETASRIVASSEAYEPWGTDPTTGKSGIKFDTGYEGGSSGGGGKDKTKGPKASVGGQIVLASYRSSTVLAATALQTIGESRTIVLTFTGQVDVEWVEVTTKAGSDQVSTGTLDLGGGNSSTGESGEDCTYDA
ncbi:MAG: hypothetical protein K8L99_35105 [Anaerolineae bacterium]|nr:hypothetical protein [Anaerolineae bacterium]